MTFISYAQNFEDVLLWRALRHVPSGFYIDVGASNPDVDSVTRAFFERGWRGINIEPGLEDAARIAAARPGDITLQLAAGREDGEAEFFTIPGTGLSTLDAAVAELYRDPKWNLQRGRIAVRTLAGICRAQVRSEIHFLKIDVEGAEAEVLAGADLLTWRPWIILVEATAPLSTEQTHDAWEPGLLEQGYRFVWFDGLNRFYLSDERHDELSVHFRTPPNVFDDFIRAADTVWAARIASAEAQSAALDRLLTQREQGALAAAARAAERADRAGHEIVRLQRLLGDERQANAVREAAEAAELNHAAHELHAARHELQQTHLRLQATLRERDAQARALRRAAQDKIALEQAGHELHAARHELQQTHLRLQAALRECEQRAEAVAASEQKLAALHHSTSWRLTGPLRVGKRLLRPEPAAAPAPASAPAPAPASLPEQAPAPVPVPEITEPLAPAIEPEAPMPEIPAAPAVQLSPAPKPSAAVPAPAAPVLPPDFFDILPPPPASRPRPGTDRRHVHQFHSGSAVGDAVTNAMLLTRTLLRGLGYESEIFVVHRDPELAHELRSIDELPLHDEYVLILRHSIGYDQFDRVMALPAPKILIYHNITPVELLTRHPHLAAYAALGRRQLAALPGHVHAALADSDYNAIELRELGFNPVRSCTLLFDIADLRARADRTPAARGEVFTILFIGRICQSKAQIELVRAFNAFRTRYRGPARLVLVGRQESGSDPYVRAVKRTVAQSAHPNEILLTGLVSDEERDAWYGRADLYVSLSRHEGFGVPLVEAMAHGVPVLALPSGAVPYTLGNAASLLPDDAGAAEIGAILHDWAADPARRRAQAAAQRASLDRFALPRQTTILQGALLRAGAALRDEAHDALDANLHFAVTGHVNGSYSLAAVNRGLALELQAARPGRVRLIPVEGVVTSDLSGIPPEQRDAVTGLVRHPAPLTAPELILSQHFPVHVPPRQHGQIRLAFLFWEESLLPDRMIATLESGFDGVVAPTRFVARALQDSGLRLPVRVIPHAPRLHAFRGQARAPGAPLTFLHVSSCFPRKGADLLLRAWAASFTGADPVRLVIKSFPNPHNTVAADLEALRQRHADLAPVTLIDRDLDEAALADLYAQSDVMVLPTRGEGYNLPAAEALAAGLRLIVTGAGGHMDFCDPDDPRIRLLRFRHAPSESHVAAPHALWLEPDPDDLAAALREALLQPSPSLPQPATARPGAVADGLARFGLDLLLKPPAPVVRIGWVSSWNQRCGIAEYSRLLLDALEPDPATAITILCDTRTPAYAALPDSPPHIPCWLNGGDVADGLLEAIARTDPQAVMLQHQPGMVPWRHLPGLIEGIVAQDRVLALTLHNTRELLDLSDELRAELAVAFSRADRVIVHTRADLDRLTGLGLANTTLFPHGVRAPLPAAPPRPLGQGDAPVIGCYGFFLPGKGIDILAEAALRLRDTWPGLQLRLVNAAYGGAQSDAEIARTREIAEPLGKAVQFHTGFLPQDQSLALLAGCDIVVLPHRPSKEAFSGALSTALTASVPVAVSNIRLFDEADSAVQRVDARSPESLARDLDALLRDTALRARLQQDAQTWMQARAWPPLARRLIGLLTGMARSRNAAR